MTLSAALLSATPAQAAETTLTAKLTPQHEDSVQGRAGAGQPGAAGTFAARLDSVSGELCYRLAWTGVERVTMAHIHAAASGPDGPPLVAFEDIGGEGGGDEHCQPIGRTLAEQLAARPGDFYVNVHSEAYPNGAVSGAVERQ